MAKRVKMQMDCTTNWQDPWQHRTHDQIDFEEDTRFSVSPAQDWDDMITWLRILPLGWERHRTEFFSSIKWVRVNKQHYAGIRELFPDNTVR